MSWYYLQRNEQRGPFDDREMQRLVSQGAIGARTLVWRQGLPDWIPWAEASASRQPVALGSAGFPGGPHAHEAVAPGACAVCGRFVGDGEVTPVTGSVVCAACKADYLRRIREGRPGPSELCYAGFWIRLAAKIVDVLLLALPTAAVVLASRGILAASLSFPGAPGSPSEALFLGRLLTGLGVFVVLNAVYSIGFVGAYEATPGKMLLGLRIVRPDGSRLSRAKAVGRFFAEWITGTTFALGYAIAAFDAEKRALHDHLCDTRVMRV